MSGDAFHQIGTTTLLRGVRVLDLSAYLPGPYCTRLLADLGADVIKVEHPNGDPIREFMPGVYEFLNRGKRVVPADAKLDEGRDFVRRLAATCDVFVEAFRPGVTDRLGLGVDHIAAVTPGIVYCSISSHGQDGPARDRAGHNIGFEASGGVYAPVMEAGEAPVPSPTALADTGAASFAALTICAALVGRRSGGVQPVRLDVSLEEVVAYLAAPRWGTSIGGPDVPAGPTGAMHAPGNGLFRTADDRFLALAAVEDHLWRSSCAWLELPELVESPFDVHAGRMAAAERLRDTIARRVAERTAGEWLSTAEGHDVPVELARTYREVFTDEHLINRGFVREGLDRMVLEYPVRVGRDRSVSDDGLLDTADVTEALVRELDQEGRLRAAWASSGALPLLAPASSDPVGGV